MTKIIQITFLLFVIGTVNLTAKSLRIESKDLANNLNSFKILDTRDRELYKKGHISGSLNFPIGLTYEDLQKNGKLSNPINMQSIIRALGLNINSKIVIYDDGTFFDASRLFWALEVYGFKNVKLLNTGYSNWKSLNYKTSLKDTKVTPSKYIAQINSKRLATKFTTQIATKNPNQIIIDARGKKAYLGQVSSASRFGHIPKAVSFPASHNISYQKDNSKLKNIDALKELYKDVDKNKKIVIYCAVGRIAATNYFALRELDYNVSNYDASWNEWGNDKTLPITNRSKE
jgi:thiosulfate/3-mercaptopyruvate sulfurtransferase